MAEDEKRFTTNEVAFREFVVGKLSAIETATKTAVKDLDKRVTRLENGVLGALVSGFVLLGGLVIGWIKDKLR